MFDTLVAAGGTAVFEETGELIGCEHHMAGRAVTDALGSEIEARVAKAAEYYTAMGHGSFSPGNAEGGLTTLEEKSLGAYSKSGTGPIHGVVTPGQRIPGPGLYLLDVVPEGPPRWGFPNINDNAEIAELIACGAHLVLFTTGRGSVVGSAISPVVKICANPDTYRRMSEDMDVDAGRILEGRAGIGEVAAEVLDVIARDRGRSPDGQRAPRAPRVRAHLQVERAGWPGLPADGSMTTRVTFTGYERAALQPTVVHIGPGVFHRAHQAVYCDAVLRTGSPTGAVWGISLRSAAVRASPRATRLRLPRRGAGPGSQPRRRRRSPSRCTARRRRRGP